MVALSHVMKIPVDERSFQPLITGFSQDPEMA